MPSQWLQETAPGSLLCRRAFLPQDQWYVIMPQLIPRQSSPTPPQVASRRLQRLDPDDWAKPSLMVVLGRD